MVFNRVHIHRCPNGFLILEIKEYIEGIHPLPLTKDRRRQSLHRWRFQELAAYQSLAGSLKFLGHRILPQAAFAASHLRQAVGRLTVSYMFIVNQLLAGLKRLEPMITFRSFVSLDKPCYLAFSDASQGSSSSGRTGYISGIFLSAEGAKVFQSLERLSCNQKRVPFSSMGAEILAAASAADRGSLRAQSISILNRNEIYVPLVLSGDSRGL